MARILAELGNVVLKTIGNCIYYYEENSYACFILYRLCVDIRFSCKIMKNKSNVLYTPFML